MHRMLQLWHGLLVCLSVGHIVSSTKTDEPMAILVVKSDSPGNHVLSRGLDHPKERGYFGGFLAH